MKTFMLAFVGAVLLFSMGLHAAYSGGVGIQADPYQISVPADWQDLIEAPADWSKHFVLTADINLSGVLLFPVGDIVTPFTGIFEGNSHTISNVTINLPGTQ